jgi:predicted component of type VI protein secretion system
MRCTVSTRLVVGAWALIVLVLHAACATSAPARSSTAERIHLSLSTRFEAVRVSESELDEALATLVLTMPLRVAGSHPSLALPRRGEAWCSDLTGS